MIDTIRDERIKKAKKFQDLGLDPYATKSKRTVMAMEVVDDYSSFEGKKVTVSGRLMTWRDFGKLAFAQLKDGSGAIQLYFKKDNIADKWDQLKLYDIGDFVDASGVVTKTKTGEISIEVGELSILTKSLRPLPEKWEGLKDVESRYRHRYLDLLLNEESKARLMNRSAIIRAIREFLWSRDFIEVDCPVLQPLYGGGKAKPFTTHVDAIDITAYLSISNELYLKRAVVGGIENVFTIGRLFRNEGIDRSHNPEFSLLETMSAYQNYEYNMDLMEEMYKYICKSVFDRYEFKIGGQMVDFGKDWRRVKMVDLVKEETGKDFDSMSLKEANSLLDSEGVEKQDSVGEALVEYMDVKVAHKLIQPTIVYGHPVEISPLTKRIPGDSKYVERFELFIGGIETGDNWTELNDPQELYERFKAEQEKQEEDSHPVDMDFIEAMEYGMPPTTGLGPGIERLAMMLTDTENIDDVIWFPLMKPESK